MKSLNGMVSSHRWNLIGELFVLEYLQNAFEAEKMIEAFHTSKKYLLFLYQSIEDYADVDKYGGFSGIMVIDKTLGIAPYLLDRLEINQKTFPEKNSYYPTVLL